MTQRTSGSAEESAAALGPRADRLCGSAGPAPDRPLARRGQPGSAAAPLSALLRELRTLFQLRGVSYVCVVDESTGHVAGERGITPGERVPAGLVEWARNSAAPSGASTAPHDVMITTSTAHHLLQRIGPRGSGTTAWVYLHVVRDRGTVAVARQALASLAVLREDPAAPPVREDARPATPVPSATTTPAPLDASIPLPRRRSTSLPPPPSRFPRRTEGSRAPGGRATSGTSVLTRSWSTDDSTLERLLVGLRLLA